MKRGFRTRTVYLKHVIQSRYFEIHYSCPEPSKYMFNIVLCQDICEPICFELGRMLNMTKLYSLIAVWMPLMFAQSHRVTGDLELVQSFCCKVPWSSSNERWPWRNLVSMANMDHVLSLLFQSESNQARPPCWPSGKASASSEKDPGFESRLRRDFSGAESYRWLQHWHSSGYPARRLAL